MYGNKQINNTRSYFPILLPDPTSQLKVTNNWKQNQNREVTEKVTSSFHVDYIYQWVIWFTQPLELTQICYNGLLSRMKIYTVQSLISQPGPKQAYTFELKLDQRLLIIKSHKLVSIYEKFQWQLFFEGYAYVDSQCQTVAAVFLLVDDSLADLLNQGMKLCHGCLSYLGDEHVHVLLVLLVHQFSISY